MLLQVSPDLPCYLLGHGMGALTVESFLGLNPLIAEKLAGIIYSAPMFGMRRQYNIFQKIVVNIQASLLDEMMMIEPIPIQKMSRNRPWTRLIVT